MLNTDTLFMLSRKELQLLVKELILNCETSAAVDYIKAEAWEDDEYKELLSALVECKVLQ